MDQAEVANFYKHRNEKTSDMIKAAMGISVTEREYEECLKLQQII